MGMTIGIVIGLLSLGILIGMTLFSLLNINKLDELEAERNFYREKYYEVRDFDNTQSKALLNENAGLKKENVELRAKCKEWEVDAKKRCGELGEQRMERGQINANNFRTKGEKSKERA